MKDYAKNILLTAIGGITLAICTVVLSAFLSSPPTRAEFDAHKMETTLQYQTINGKLKELKEGQNKILDHIVNKRN